MKEPDNLEAGLALLDDLSEDSPKEPASRPQLDEDKLVDTIADSGFLRSYVGYASGATEAPRLFHLGVGLVLLGTAMGNRVRIPAFGYAPMYSNLWLVLIAPTGIFYKSTSMGIGVRLLTSANKNHLLPDQFTPEALIQILAKQPAGLLVAHEFAGLLEYIGSKREYVAGTKELLTVLFDGTPYKRATKKSGSFFVDNAAPSILGATTMEWLKDAAAKKDLRGGFLARFLWLPATKLGKPIRGLPDLSNPVRDELQDFLKEIGHLDGTVDFSLVNHGFDVWQRAYRKKINVPGAVEPELFGIFSRGPALVLKLATILQVSYSEGEPLRISSRALSNAIVLLENLQERAVEVVSGFSDSWVATQRRKVLELVKAHGEISKSELLRKMRDIRSRDLNTIIATLLETEEIEKGRSTSEGPGRRAEIYRLKG